MTGDEELPEPGPVAEYRDPELVRRFEAEPVPQHGAGFWADLEARLGADGSDAEGRDAGDEGWPVAAPIELVSTPAPAGRWGTSRWLAVAAVTVALVGLGGIALVTQGRSSSPVQSASPSPDPGPGADGADGVDPAPSSTVTTGVATTTSAPTTSTTTEPVQTVEPGPDYFDDGIRVDPIGPGRVLAFSPDDTAVLLVDDAPGVATGCEGAEVLGLVAQDLATGERRPALGDRTIETGGLELAIDPFGATPSEVGTRPVYGLEWCDGVPGPPWRGVMSSDGRISRVESVEAGGTGDPFVAVGADLRTGDGLPSPDGRHLLRVSGDTIEVVEVGQEPERTGEVVGSLPDSVDPESAPTGAWAPAGTAVAINTRGSLILWSPWTGDRQRFEGGNVTDMVFDHSGSRLAVTSWDDVGPTASILTFGDRTAPASAPPRCSGRTSFPALSAETLAEGGLPKTVIQTVLTIDRAAATCDWEAMEELVPDGFVASLGGGDPVEIWRDEEALGRSPMWYLRTLFRQPSLVVDDGASTLHLWPAIEADRDCRYDQDERESLAALGYDPDDQERACAVTDGYAGFRTSIDDDGQWRSFLAGD